MVTTYSGGYYSRSSALYVSCSIFVFFLTNFRFIGCSSFITYAIFIGYFGCINYISYICFISFINYVNYIIYINYISFIRLCGFLGCHQICRQVFGNFSDIKVPNWWTVPA